MKIGELLENSQYGISISMNEDKIGYPIYRMNEISKMLTKSEVEKYADINGNELNNFKLKDKDVLFNRTNSLEWVGRTGIFYKNSEKDYIFASYLVRFNTNKQICLPEYLTVFLNSKFGVEQLKSRVRESINQANINPEEVKEIEIPLLNMELQKLIESNFLIANESKILSENLYKEAENLLLKELELDNYKLSEENISIKSLSSSFLESGRLDAEYYQPKYDEMIEKIPEFSFLKDICNIYDNSYNPIFDKEYKYIELSDIDQYGNVAGYTQENGEALPTRAKRIVKANNVIISSIEGSLDKCALIREEHNNSLCSTGFYVIDSPKINSETLLVMFKSNLMNQLLRRYCSGTILTSISKEDFLKIPIPKISNIIQKEISDKIKKSFYLKERSEQLLESSVKAVEMAIEKTEEEAIKYLEEEVKKLNIKI